MNAKTFSRRRLLKGAAFALAGAGMTALAGCQPKVVEVTREVEKVVERTVVTEKIKEMILLRWHHRLGGWQCDEDRIKRFMDEHPDVKVNEEEFPAGSAEYGPKIASLVAANMVGDVTWVAIGSGSFQFLAQNNALAGLDELINVDSSGFSLDEYYPRTISGLRYGPGGQGTGDLLALPELAHATYDCLFYNKTMFDAEGIAAPSESWTRDDLLQLAKDLTGGDRFGFLPVTGGYSEIRYHTLAWGGELMSADGKTSLLEDEKVKAATRWVHDLFFRDKVSPLAQDMAGGRNPMFVAGQLAMFESGGWDLAIKSVIQDQFEWDMVLMPTGPAGVRGGHLHLDGEAVTAQSKNKQLAYEFCKTLTDYKSELGICNEIGLVARPDVYADPSIEVNKHLVLLGKSTEEALEHLGPANLRKQESQTTLKALFDPLWTGDAQPDDAFFADISAQWQEFLDKQPE